MAEQEGARGLADDETVEFETAGTERPVHALRQGIKFSELQNGVEFETDEANDDEEFDTGENELWWSKEELLKHLENHPNDDSASLKEGEVAFDVLKCHMVPLTEDGGVHKRIVRTGVGLEIGEHASISYHCEAYLDGSDTPFDSTVLRGRPFLHRLDSDPILPGLLIGLRTMSKYEVAQILVNHDYAFGELGCPPRVPGSAAILYRVEILNIYEEGSLASFQILSDAERQKFDFSTVMEMCNAERISGNSYFKHNKCKEALKRYRAAIQVLERYTYASEAHSKEANSILLKLYCNAANVCNKLQKPIIAMSYCKRALALDPDSVKGIYQYGKAKYINGNNEMARDLLLRAKELEPNNRNVADMLRKIDERINFDRITEEDCYRRMARFFVK